MEMFERKQTNHLKQPANTMLSEIVKINGKNATSFNLLP